MTKLRLLDLFCGAGGCSAGYMKAGFDVVGVDINPQKNYPYEFIQADALEILQKYGPDFDAIHASPPCQAHSVASNIHNGKPYQKKHPELIEPTRISLLKANRPFVIENVPGAPLMGPVILCGTMFPGLKVYRHRLFECHPFKVDPPGPCNHIHHMGKSKGEYHTLDKSSFITCVGHNFQAKSGRIAMKIDWMTRDELAQAIPPDYTEYIGRHLMQFLLSDNLK